MTDDDARRLVRDCLATIAPEASVEVLEALDGDASLRDELDLDSIDVLALAAAIGERLGVDIAEREFPWLATLDGSVALVRSLTSGQ